MTVVTETIVVQAPFTTATSHIVLDEDWMSPLPRIMEDGEVKNITGSIIEIYVRPTHDHTTLIKKLSTATGEILITDGPGGLASINMSAANVVSTFPIGQWDHFCRIFPPGGGWTELFRGPFYVHPGRTG